MVGGNRVGLGIGIFFHGNPPGKPCRNFVLARTGSRLGHRSAGQDILALGKIHEELTRDRLQQPALMAERHAMLCSRPRSGFEQRLLHARGLLAHGIERLAMIAGRTLMAHKSRTFLTSRRSEKE